MRDCLRVSVAVTKHQDHKASWGGRVYSAYTSTLLFTIKEVRTRTGQDPGGESWCRGHGGVLAYWLASPDWLNSPCRTWHHLPRESATHYGLDPPPLITNWENAFQMDPLEAFPQVRLLPLWWLACFKLTHKISSTETHPLSCSGICVANSMLSGSNRTVLTRGQLFHEQSIKSLILLKPFFHANIFFCSSHIVLVLPCFCP